MIAPAKPAPRPLPVVVGNPEIEIPDAAVEAVVGLLFGVVERQDAKPKPEIEATNEYSRIPKSPRKSYPVR